MSPSEIPGNFTYSGIVFLSGILRDKTIDVFAKQKKTYVDFKIEEKVWTLIIFTIMSRYDKL